jgi:hypothetical protein
LSLRTSSRKRSASSRWTNVSTAFSVSALTTHLAVDDLRAALSPLLAASPEGDGSAAVLRGSAVPTACEATA